MNKITAYDILTTIDNYRNFLDINPYFYIMSVSVIDCYMKMIDRYFLDEFFDKEAIYKPKTILNEYEIRLFKHHPAFIEQDGMFYFKGYSLLKIIEESL